MSRVYLAGPITGLNYKGATNWREYATKKLAKHNIQCFSPMRAKEYLKELEIIHDVIPTCEKNPLSSSPGIVSRDRLDVMKCDLMLVNFLGAKTVSIGTCIEFGWADAFRKPIILIMEKEGNPHSHKMLEYLANFRVETLEEGILIARAILNP